MQDLPLHVRMFYKLV